MNNGATVPVTDILTVKVSTLTTVSCPAFQSVLSNILYTLSKTDYFL